MGAGRPPACMNHVYGLDGSYAMKHRLEVILATLMGDLPIAEACERLAIKESRFHDLRRMALEGALEALRPGYGGRPGKNRRPHGELERLRREVSELRWELQMERSRNEMERIKAITNGKGTSDSPKKGVSRAKVRRRSRKRARH